MESIAKMLKYSKFIMLQLYCIMVRYYRLFNIFDVFSWTIGDPKSVFKINNYYTYSTKLLQSEFFFLSESLNRNHRFKDSLEKKIHSGTIY